jgi:hypothetical protein
MGPQGAQITRSTWLPPSSSVVPRSRSKHASGFSLVAARLVPQRPTMILAVMDVADLMATWLPLVPCQLCRQNLPTLSQPALDRGAPQRRAGPAGAQRCRYDVVCGMRCTVHDGTYQIGRAPAGRSARRGPPEGSGEEPGPFARKGLLRRAALCSLDADAHGPPGK